MGSSDAPPASPIDFFISEKDEWNSLKKEIAERKTSVKGVVKVGVRRLASLMDEFGVPYYCKIDIEGVRRVDVWRIGPGARRQ